MASFDKVVIRFNNGDLLKGYLKEFSQESPAVSFQELGGNVSREIAVEALKAIFFVRTFEGDSDYKEKKRYGIRKKEGRKIFVQFKDGESMVGFLQGDMPWDRGFHISKPDGKKTGFFIIPVDEDSNNIKVYIFKLSLKDVTAIP